MSCNRSDLDSFLSRLRMNNTEIDTINGKIDSTIKKYNQSKSSDDLKEYMRLFNKIKELSAEIKTNLRGIKRCETNLTVSNDTFSTLQTSFNDAGDGLASQPNKIDDELVSMCQSVSAETSKCGKAICDIYDKSKCENEGILSGIFGDAFDTLSKHMTTIIIAITAIVVVGVGITLSKKRGPTIQL